MSSLLGLPAETFVDGSLALLPAAALDSAEPDLVAPTQPHATSIDMSSCLHVTACMREESDVQANSFGRGLLRQRDAFANPRAADLLPASAGRRCAEASSRRSTRYAAKRDSPIDGELLVLPIVP
jgi:hypothetical protein